jgi:hypothetical protein
VSLLLDGIWRASARNEAPLRKVWHDEEFPENKYLIPGVIESALPVIE